MSGKDGELKPRPVLATVMPRGSSTPSTSKGRQWLPPSITSAAASVPRSGTRGRHVEESSMNDKLFKNVRLLLRRPLCAGEALVGARSALPILKLLGKVLLARCACGKKKV